MATRKQGLTQAKRSGDGSVPVFAQSEAKQNVIASEAKQSPPTGEVAVITGGRDITRGYVDSMPYLAPTDRILGVAGGWKGYEELLRDDQIQATFQQRRLAVVRKPWTVEPASSSRIDKRAAELVEETLKRIPWDNITDQMLYARFFGYAVAEIIWEIGTVPSAASKASADIRVADIRVRDRARFGFAVDGALRMFTMQAPLGEALPDRKFWVASVGASHHDEPYGRGLANALYWPTWFKRNGARFWSVYLEKFGAPTPVGKFPNNTSEDQKNKLLQALSAIQTDAAVAIPDSMVVELLEATRGGNAGYENWMSYWDHCIAKIVLGQTMTTDNGSSLAQAQVHMQVREDFVASDADLICASASETWIKWLVEYNIPGAAVPKVWRETEVQEDLKTRADRDKTLKDMGYKLTPDAVKRIYGDDYEAIERHESPVTGSAGVSPASTAGVPPATPPPATVEAAERSPFEGGSWGMLFSDQSALDDAINSISAETLDAQGSALLAPIMEILGTVPSAANNVSGDGTVPNISNADKDPAAFLGWLAEKFPGTDPGQLEDMLTRLIFISELWGSVNAEA